MDSALAGRPVQLADFAQLPYTRAVINEVLRCYPVSLVMRRARITTHLRDVERKRPTIDCPRDDHDPTSVRSGLASTPCAVRRTASGRPHTVH
ncbi:cytochrome P450 [Kibdelosporangium philippinense]|uniref:cytochrome P450 n=1 Tax=Kibdelosporangium philippinense TaxID=211113 RepID=UPI00360D274B